MRRCLFRHSTCCYRKPPRVCRKRPLRNLFLTEFIVCSFGRVHCQRLSKPILVLDNLSTLGKMYKINTIEFGPIIYVNFGEKLVFTRHLRVTYAESNEILRSLNL